MNKYLKSTNKDRNIKKYISIKKFIYIYIYLYRDR